jgi:hypothetical protein
MAKLMELMRFQVLTVTSMKMAVLWAVIWTLLIALIMDAVNSSETSVIICQTTRRNIPEDSHLLAELYCGRRNEIVRIYL